MGVIFQNGMAIGAVPGYSNFGIPRSWLLGIDNFGCQPAWDNGVMVLIPWFIGVGVCFGSDDLFGVIGDGRPNFGFYMSGIDSTGTNQSTFLSQVIGQTGTMSFTQGGSSITIGFDETTFHANTYSSTGGIYYENNSGITITPPFIVGGTGTFYGFNNAGNGTNSSGGSGEQYYAQPSNSQLLTIDINIGPIVTPTPTSTATPTPTATPTATPAGPTLYSFNISGWYANDIDACSGNAVLPAYSTNNGYPQMGDTIYIDNAGTTTYGAGFYLTVYGSTIELDSSGVIIGGPNSC
jgi:hypothetical protein